VIFIYYLIVETVKASPTGERKGLERAKRVAIATKEAGQEASATGRAPTAHASGVLSGHSVEANTLVVVVSCDEHTVTGGASMRR
jgi:hypothetical protein